MRIFGWRNDEVRKNVTTWQRDNVTTHYLGRRKRRLRPNAVANLSTETDVSNPRQGRRLRPQKRKQGEDGNFLVHPENRVIGFVLLAIRPAELGKTTNTTFTTSNNLHASRVLQSCCQVNNKIQGFARTLRQEKSAGNVSKAKRCS